MATIERTVWTQKRQEKNPKLGKKARRKTGAKVRKRREEKEENTEEVEKKKPRYRNYSPTLPGDTIGNIALLSLNFIFCSSFKVASAPKLQFDYSLQLLKNCSCSKVTI